VCNRLHQLFLTVRWSSPSRQMVWSHFYSMKQWFYLIHHGTSKAYVTTRVGLSMAHFFAFRPILVWLIWRICSQV
jgi:hypothetical protein